MRRTCQHYLQEGLEICQTENIHGEKNLISQRLIELRRQHNMSQRLLAYQLQLNGYDMDKNVITRIGTNKRYVTDVELKAY